MFLAELIGHGVYFAIKCLKKNVVIEDNDVESTMIEVGKSFDLVTRLLFSIKLFNLFLFCRLAKSISSGLVQSIHLQAVLHLSKFGKWR